MGELVPSYKLCREEPCAVGVWEPNTTHKDRCDQHMEALYRLEGIGKVDLNPRELAVNFLTHM